MDNNKKEIKNKLVHNQKQMQKLKVMANNQETITSSDYRLSVRHADNLTWLCWRKFSSPKHERLTFTPDELTDHEVESKRVALNKEAKLLSFCSRQL